MLTNAPIKYEYDKPLPVGWATVVDRQVFSRSDHVTVVYDTPKYKGKINWCHNEFYGYLAGSFELNGETLQGSSGFKIHECLKIPEDYCIRIGKDGWDKFLTKEYFEMWLQKP